MCSSPSARTALQAARERTLTSTAASSSRSTIAASAPRARNCAQRRGGSGFTLLEIAVVIFIMGLIMLIALPYFGSLAGAQLRSQSRRLADRATFLFDAASAQRVVFRMTFNLDRGCYSIARLDPFALRPVFAPDHEPGGSTVCMPGAVRIRDVAVAGVGDATSGAISCNFYPSGYVDPTLVHLVDRNGEVDTLYFNPVTGEVAILRGDLSQRGAALRQ